MSTHTKPLIDEHGEVRELTTGDMKKFKPAADVLPDLVREFKRSQGERGPQKEPTKERITIRLDAEVVEHFRGTGSGWQTRLNEVLKEQIKKRD